ncbi:hypothetical protein C483_05433 [Natrialba hulunbeirensis JCM 10989]|uniref:SHOCT domain-containing protein n=1 Tax=Natrialba hulunbeirensis JCM 10989 TaxID=1227493 RepID=M0A654_9EURY|nr:SHOCT domain-containing protein [Natrialba hulunbeirensis]ELY93382.1 hypothetical protein C483_05433 [Natrialba hulunbeirensis JCM 10989]
MSDDAATRFRENATEITVMVVTGLWLALLFLPVGSSIWLPVLLFGYIVVIPLVAILYGDEDDRETWWDDWWGDDSWEDWWGSNESESESESGNKSKNTNTNTKTNTNSRDESLATSREPNQTGDPTPGAALETLRQRYAAGELTDDQFEAKLERLLETETIESADRWQREPSVADSRVDERNRPETEGKRGGREGEGSYGGREPERDRN